MHQHRRLNALPFALYALPRALHLIAMAVACLLSVPVVADAQTEPGTPLSVPPQTAAPAPVYNGLRSVHEPRAQLEQYTATIQRRGAQLLATGGALVGIGGASLVAGLVRRKATWCRDDPFTLGYDDCHHNSAPAGAAALGGAMVGIGLPLLTSGALRTGQAAGMRRAGFEDNADFYSSFDSRARRRRRVGAGLMIASIFAAEAAAHGLLGTINYSSRDTERALHTQLGIALGVGLGIGLPLLVVGVRQQRDVRYLRQRGLGAPNVMVAPTRRGGLHASATWRF